MVRNLVLFSTKKIPFAKDSFPIECTSSGFFFKFYVGYGTVLSTFCGTFIRYFRKQLLHITLTHPLNHFSHHHPLQYIFLAFEEPISGPSEDIAYEATKQLGMLNHRLNLLRLEEESRQIQLPNITFNSILNRIPCSCDKGVCKCCAGK